jgi:hypothetical protein
MADELIEIVVIDNTNDLLMYMYNNHPKWGGLELSNNTSSTYKTISKWAFEKDMMKPINEKYSCTNNGILYCRTDDLFIQDNSMCDGLVEFDCKKIIPESIHMYVNGLDEVDFNHLVFTYDSMKSYITELENNKLVADILEVPQRFLTIL